MSILSSTHSGKDRIVKSYSFHWTDTRKYDPLKMKIDTSRFRPYRPS